MITSTSNQRVKELSQIQKKSKIRSREGIFIAEGIRMVRETPHERLVGLYFSESFEKKYGKEVLDVISGGDLKGCRSDRYHHEPGLRGYLQPKDDPLHHGSTLPDAVFVCG